MQILIREALALLREHAIDEVDAHTRALAVLRQPVSADPRAALDEYLDRPSRRLAAYGTLRPGESNHGQVAALRGRWRLGSVVGSLRTLGSGHPGLDLEPATTAVPVGVLESDDLPSAWARLDAFEGRDYRRTLVLVNLIPTGHCVAYAYLAARPARS